MPRAGETMAYRPMPHDFPKVFVEGGWRAVEQAFGARASIVNRWLDEYGRDDLMRARSQARRQHSRAHRYVMGRRLMSVEIGQARLELA